ncbi:CGNR zinc finger domain-containing protein [Solicola gregarius]|uniref:CGNR zinc finger domain-containing protein n=1 Tax=Solicola gregarius TaxID=2908642 RepID=A0AA46YLN1_9ACTN|nr:CGNR zinc finger domain-containing protein [Solicola gregarius]UYM06822.1 CGNR zinc finger domain-containing protein [Solicola gregarius]
MWLNPYGQDAVELMADFANARPRSVGDLVGRCRTAGVAVDMPIDEADLATTLELIDRWCEIVDTADEQERATLVNRLLAETTAHPRMSDHDGVWHMHYRPDDIPLGAVLCALASVGTALHLSGRGMHRLDRCALSECDNVYVDTSRTGRQRYCSTRCSNRDAVRRHRARKAS